MLPKAVLVAPTVAVPVTAPRLHRLPAGAACAGLRVSGPAFGRSCKSPPVTGAEARHSRCRRLAADGDLSRACAALVDPPPLPPTPSVLDELKAKHPQAAAPDTAALSPCRPGAVPEFDSNAV